MVRVDFELRPPEVCRLTKVAGRLVLGFNALSDGALALGGDDGPLLQDVSAGWLGKSLVGPDVHLLSFLDDVSSVLAIQVRAEPAPALLGEGSALELIQR